MDAAAESPPSGEALFACFGVMGGFMQPQGHVQVAIGLIDNGLDPQAALDAPRFSIASELSALAARGHALTVTSGQARAVFGRGQVIVRDAESGVLWGGSDPRADGCAMGW